MDLTEIIKKASTYVPLAKKEEFCICAVQKCLSVLSVKVDGSLVPPITVEDHSVKSRLLMGYLLKEYLHINFEPVEGETWLVSQDDYDRYAGAHIINTIERLKQDSAFRDKMFDLLYDYRETERRLNSEIHTMLAVQNDQIARLRLLAADILNRLTPQELEKAANDLKDAKAEFEGYMKEREAANG